MANQFAKSLSFPAGSSISWSERSYAGLRALVLLLCASLIAGCGFQPLYATRDGVAITASLKQISVSAPNDEVGREVRDQLLDILRPSGPALYRLEIAPRRSVTNAAVRQDAEETRSNLTLAATYVLIDMDTDKVIHKGSARAIASFSRLTSEYANVVAARDAEVRTARQVAEEIRQQLGIFFNGRQAS